MVIDLDPINGLIKDLHTKGLQTREAIIALEIMLKHDKIVAPGMAVINQLVEDYYRQHTLAAEESTPLPISKPYDRDISGRVRQWVEKAEPGEFHHEEVFRDLALSPEHKDAARAALQRMATKRDLIERAGKKRGWYRRIDDSIERIDFRNASGAEYAIKLPFNLHLWVKLYPKEIIVIAGTKDAGKSAFSLNLIHDNMEEREVYYFSNEFSDSNLKDRLLQFGRDLNEWKFHAIARSQDFQDVIKPEALNICDYLDVPEGLQPYEMNRLIDKIYRRLTTGSAVICLQKRQGSEWAVGAGSTAERARLYINLDKATTSSGDGHNTLTVKVAKTPRYPKYNPCGWQWQYRLENGCDFKIVNCPDAVKAESELRKQECWEGK